MCFLKSIITTFFYPWSGWNRSVYSYWCLFACLLFLGGRNSYRLELPEYFKFSLQMLHLWAHSYTCFHRKKEKEKPLCTCVPEYNMYLQWPNWQGLKIRFLKLLGAHLTLMLKPVSSSQWLQWETRVKLILKLLKI